MNIYSYAPHKLKTIAIQITVALVIAIILGVSFQARADTHIISLKKIFPSGKCSPIAPNYEVLVAGFTGGEITKYKIYDAQGKVLETISIFINKQKDQWVIVGSKTVRKVIFCLYSSGKGKGSVDRLTVK